MKMNTQEYKQLKAVKLQIQKLNIEQLKLLEINIKCNIIIKNIKQ